MFKQLNFQERKEQRREAASTDAWADLHTVKPM